MIKFRSRGEVDGYGDMGEWLEANSMWTRTTNCIREAARQMVGVLKGNFDGRRGDWWRNEEVQGKMEAKKVAY